MKYLLDTNTCIFHLNRRYEATQYISHPNHPGVYASYMAAPHVPCAVGSRRLAVATP